MRRRRRDGRLVDIVEVLAEVVDLRHHNLKHLHRLVGELHHTVVAVEILKGQKRIILIFNSPFQKIMKKASKDSPENKKNEVDK
jgi:hypothetical protein